MTVAVLDAFNRVAADLTTSPAGRWAAPAGSGGTNAWGADGQRAKTATTFAASSRGRLTWTTTDPGVDYAEVRVTFTRATSNSQEIGLFARAHRSTPSSDHRRLAIVWRSDTSPTRWELRWYSTLTAYQTILVALDNVTGFVMDTNPHLLKLRFVPLNCQGTANTSACSSPASSLALTATVDGIMLFGAVSWPDLFLIPGPLSLYRGFGIEVLSNAAWRVGVPAPDDYVAFDDIEMDNLITPNAEPAPTLIADPVLARITVGTEGAASGSLPITPDTGELVGKDWFTVRTPTEAGYEVTWAKYQSGRRLWEVGHAGLTLTETNSVLDFLDAHGGGETSFNYVNPEGATVKACFLSETLRVTKDGVGTFGATYVIEEAF